MANKIITVDTLTYFKTKLMEKLDVWKNSIESWKTEINTWKGTIDTWKSGIDTWKSGIDSWKTSISSTVATLQSGKQDKLTAGSNIQISGSNVISATDTTYTAGSNINISGTTISATDTTYTAGAGISISGNTISATGTSGDIFNVTIEYNGTTYVADKTAQDIFDAVTGGKSVIATYHQPISDLNLDSYSGLQLEGVTYNTQSLKYDINFTRYIAYEYESNNYITVVSFTCSEADGTETEYTRSSINIKSAT